MASLLVLHAEEAFWAGDKRAEGKLKDLVTGLMHRLEFKGIEPIMVNNFIRLFVTANHDWVVPADFGERRSAVFDMSEKHARDFPYFAAIDDEWDRGGREAMLYHLLYKVKPDEVNLREIPRTVALLEQIIATSTPERAWWFDTLSNGTLPWGASGPNTCPKRALYLRYIKHAQLHGVNRRQIETVIGMFLRKYVGPDLKSDRKQQYKVPHRFGHTHETGYVFEFPPLKDCRERFAKEMGQEVSWNDPEADWQHEEQRVEAELF
jgi:hypothetical protein